MTRINETFTRLRGRRPALITYLMAGDPNETLTQEAFLALPDAGADIVEMGMPFSDPMADGPAVAEAGRRALAGGWTMAKTLALVTAFRAQHPTVPLILMGYANPILAYGYAKFAQDAHEAGADGLLLVDLPPEESGELTLAAKNKGLALIRLIAPTTTAQRVSLLTKDASGFLYYVSLTGVTGAATADPKAVATHIQEIRHHTTLPIVAGFGIKTPANAKAFAPYVEGVVVGSALTETLFHQGKDSVLNLVQDLAGALANKGRGC